MNARRRALFFLAVGVGVAVYGVAIVWLPAALVLTGVALCAYGLFGIEVDR